MLDEAAEFLGKDAEGEKKSPAGKTEKKGADTKDAKDEAAGTKELADFEAQTMKWKLLGKTLKIKTDKDTKYMKGTSADDAKTGDAAAGTGDNKKDGAAGKDEKTAQKDGTAGKDDKAAQKNVTAGKDEKTTQKDDKAASKEGSGTAQSTAVEQKDIQEGMFIKVTVKDDGSMTASEVLILSDVKEVKPVG